MKKAFLKNTLFVLLIGVLFSACSESEKPFDPATWNDQVDGFYTNRSLMVNDLLDNHMAKGMHYDSIVLLLGRPSLLLNNIDYKIRYTLTENYAFNIDPVSGSYLTIYFNQDSLLYSIEVIEW